MRTDSGWNCTPCDRQLAVAQPHHDAVDGRGHLEAVGHGVARDDERVVARRGERVGQPANTPGRRGRSPTSSRASPVRRARRRRRRAGRCTGGRGTRRAPGRPPRRRPRSRRSTRRRPRAAAPGPGDTSTASGSRARSSSSVEGVVAVHLGLGTELTEVLHEVVDERVVVVDHERPSPATTLPVAACTPRDSISSRQPPVKKPATQAHLEPPHPAKGSRDTPPRPEEGPAEPPVGAGRDVHLPRARRGGDRGQLPAAAPGRRGEQQLPAHRPGAAGRGFVLSTFFR